MYWFAGIFLILYVGWAIYCFLADALREEIDSPRLDDEMGQQEMNPRVKARLED